MMPITKSSCSVEYATSRGENSACRISSFPITDPSMRAASARASVDFPVPGSPAIRTIMIAGERRLLLAEFFERLVIPVNDVLAFAPAGGALGKHEGETPLGRCFS